MSKWCNTVYGDIYDSYEEAFDDICESSSPYEVFDYIINTAREDDIIAALDGNKPNFYTDKFMEFVEKECADYIYEILETEEEEEKDGEI